MKSFQPRGEGGKGAAGGERNGEANFRGQQRRNDTHASTTDGDARLFRKGHGRESRLALPRASLDREPPWSGEKPNRSPAMDSGRQEAVIAERDKARFASATYFQIGDGSLLKRGRYGGTGGLRG